MEGGILAAALTVKGPRGSGIGRGELSGSGPHGSYSQGKQVVIGGEGGPMSTGGSGSSPYRRGQGLVARVVESKDGKGIWQHPSQSKGA